MANSPAQGAPVSLSTHLLALFSTTRLTPSHRRVAHAILAAGPRAAYLSSTELAALAGVSQPSVTRFARALGFTGFHDFLQHVRDHTVASAPQAESAPEVLRNELQAAIADEIANLHALSAALEDPTDLYALGRQMATSVPLVVLGLRASAGLAEHFGYFAGRALGDVRVITRFDATGQETMQTARDCGATWMLCYALPRYPAETVRAVEFAKDLGLKIATISDSAQGPFTAHSETVLTVGVGSRLVFDTHSAALILGNALLGAICDADPKTVQTRLENFETSAMKRRTFVS